jgi:hypothetical protein
VVKANAFLLIHTWKRAVNTSKGKTGPHVIVTTEDRNIYNALEKYEQSKAGDRNQLKFYVNRNDVMQGSGNPKHLGKISTDSVHLSAIVALKLQLHSYVIFGNCCSNWHNVVFDFVYSGCSSTNAVPQCFQEDADPKYHMCCAWPTTKECKGDKRTESLIPPIPNISATVIQ